MGVFTRNGKMGVIGIVLGICVVIIALFAYSQISILQKNASDLETDKNYLQNQVTTLNADKAILEDQVAALEDYVADLNADKAILEDQVDTLGADKAILENRVTALQSKIDLLSFYMVYQNMLQKPGRYFVIPY